MTQQEFYLGQPGGLADMAKMEAEKPDVIAFNGYANQYKTNPITVRTGREAPHLRPRRRPEHVELPSTSSAPSSTRAVIEGVGVPRLPDR